MRKYFSRKQKSEKKKRNVKSIVLQAGIGTAAAVLNGIYFFMKLLPVQKKIVYLSRQQNTPPLDFELIIREMNKKYPAYKNVLLVRMVPDGICGKIGYGWYLLKQMYHLATAETAILDTYSIPVCLLKQRKQLKVIQIWHALGAFKKFSFSILDQEEGRSSELARAMHMHENYTWVLTSSKYCLPYFQEAFGASAEQMKVIPLPRAAYISSPETKEKVSRALYREYPQLENCGKKILVYAPTFRKYEIDFQKSVSDLTGQLDPGKYQLIVKLHPLSEVKIAAPGVIVDRKFPTHEVLQIADALITDYSAVIFEAALLGLPMYFYAFDFQQYAGKRNFYLDYETEMPGPVACSAGDLVKELEKETCSREKVEDFCRRMIDPDYRNSAKKIAELAVNGKEN